MNTCKIAGGDTRGSSLIVVIMFLAVMTTALASILRYSSNTHRNSSRQEVYDQARLIADSEMEVLYYVWKQQALLGTLGDVTTNALRVAGYLASDADPFSAGTKQQGLRLAPTKGGWRIDRQMEFKDLPGRPDGGASGQVPGTQKLGHNFYFEARVIVRLEHSIFGKMEYRAARRFVQTEASLFQNAIYYQDDLEIAASGQLVVNGDITCNGDIYLGAQPSDEAVISDLIIYGKAKIFGKLNGLTITTPYDGSIGTVMRKPGSLGKSELHDPIFDPSAGRDSPPSDQTATRIIQVQKLDVPENVLGGVSAPTLVEPTSSYYQAYCPRPEESYVWTSPITEDNRPDVNNVYRSVIAPPPVDATGGVIPEDPIIASRRMYKRAGIIITLKRNTITPAVTDMLVGDATNEDRYTSMVASHMNLVIPASDRRKTITDARENRTVYVSDVHINQLISAISHNSTISSNFNGVIYIHDTTPGTLNAIRLKDATSTPVITDANGQPKGFTIVSNNGIYIQGDFNTTQVPASSGRFNPCAIMGDAITVLSANFNDSTSGSALALRPSTANITINSAIISGNMPSDTGTTSGGVQNLVRYLEDWTAGGHSATFHGSLSQLFRSTQFVGIYIPNGGDYNVYTNPTPRVFDFDPDLADTPPALSPKSSSYFRGEHYTF